MYVLVRPPRAFERSASDAFDLVLVPLDLEAAFAQEFVKKRALTNSYPDSFLSYIASEVTGDSFIFSEIFMFWRQPKNLWGRCWSNISHVFFMPDAVGVVLYGEANAVIIPCGTEKCAIKVYGALASNAHRMGYPSNVTPLSVIIEEQTFSKEKREGIVNKRVLAATQAGVMDNYRFGSANYPSMKKVGGVESAVLRRMENAVLAGFATWALLDEAVWRLIGDWDCSHVALQASRCCAAVIINKSRSPVQVPRVQVLSGRNFLLLGSAATGYEIDSRYTLCAAIHCAAPLSSLSVNPIHHSFMRAATLCGCARPALTLTLPLLYLSSSCRVIMPGGCALVFAWAFSPTPLDTGHLTVSISTAAFGATVGSMQKDSVCEERGGFTVGFLEKTVSDWWSKYVILVT